MATQAQRLEKINEIVTNGLVPEGSEEWLESLTDNQLASIADPEGLDDLVTLAFNAEADDDEDDDEEDDEPADNGKAMIENMSDEDLAAEMTKRKGKKKKPAGNGKKPFSAYQKKKGESPDTNAHSGSLETSDWFLSAPPEAQRLLLNAKAAEDLERDELIEMITANEANEFSEDTLKSTKVETLRGLAKLAHSGLNARPVTANDYSGRATGSSLVGNSHEEEPLGLPDLGWSSSAE